MNLFSTEIIEFINRQLNSTAADLMLQASKYPNWNMKAIAQQLVGKQIAKNKLPSWFSNDNVLYPVRLSMEQCSSEITARYKANILQNGKGIDLTGGFGVDTNLFAQHNESVIYCERNEELALIAKNNFNAFNQTNCIVEVGDAICNFKKQSKLDWIFVDPARRKNTQRVYRLEDCEPNVITLQQLFFEKANLVLIKAAPLLDIKQTLYDLSSVKEVHIISVNNDCKEVLYLLEKNYSQEPEIICVNLKNDIKEEFHFNYIQESNAENEFSLPLEFLYEPNASIMKSGAFKIIAVKYNLKKLHKNSHLYTSINLVPKFPGRSFKIKSVITPDKKSLNKQVNGKANLACRNFPQKIDVLKKKLKLKDGGSDYVFATTLLDDKAKMILCKKL